MSVMGQLMLAGFSMTLIAFAMFLSIALSFKIWDDSSYVWVEWDLKWILRIISFFFALIAFMLIGLEFVMWETMIAPLI